MNEAQLGDRVRVQYSQLPELGAATDKRHRLKTCEFTVGGREVFPTLSLGVVGMTPGHRKRLTVQPHEAYGPVQRKLIREIPRVRFPKHIALQVGKRLNVVHGRARRSRRVTVLEIKLDSVLVDGNRRLAGKVIELDILLISLVSLGSPPEHETGTPTNPSAR